MSATLSSARSPTSAAKVLPFVAPLAAVGYPFYLKAFTAISKTPFNGGVILAFLVLIMAISVPVFSFYVYLSFGAAPSLTRRDLVAKRVALLSAAAPPIFTAMGVLLYMAGDPISDINLWLVLWVATFVRLAISRSDGHEIISVTQNDVSPRLRTMHGWSALAIVVLFLALHISNHLTGLFGGVVHKQVMDMFRTVYRASVIEPMIVLLFLFQIVSGLAMLWAYTKRPADFFRTLQLVSGAYLIFFILAHTNSVFFYARTFANIPTDWAFATGAPTGLLKDAWNIRLVPHYLLGVFFVLSHLCLGARIVALAHGTEQHKVDVLTKVGLVISAAIACAILAGMTGIVQL